ncbi:hypothetical protein [Plantactinospora sp. DSM 117369]
MEGAGNERVRIHEDDSVLIRGVNAKSLFLNFGDRARAEEFRDMHLAAHPDTVIKSFKVKREFLEYLRADAVPERMSRRFPTRPIAVDNRRRDGTPLADQYGLKPDNIKLMLDYIVPNSGRIG